MIILLIKLLKDEYSLDNQLKRELLILIGNYYGGFYRLILPIIGWIYIKKNNYNLVNNDIENYYKTELNPMFIDLYNSKKTKNDFNLFFKEVSKYFGEIDNFYTKIKIEKI
jgi:hypothetical protein